MKTNRIMAMLLGTTMLATLFTGCGGSGSTSGNASGSTAEGASSGAASSGAAETGSAEAPEKIVFATWTINTLPSNDAIQSVEDAINEITREKIGVEIDYQVYPVGEYSNKVAMAMQGGEQIDLFCAVQNYSSILSQEMCMDITDLVDANLPDVKALLPEDWWECAKKDGRIYTVPTWLPSALGLNIVWRSDIAEELQLDMDAVDSVDDLTAIFEKVHEAHPQMYCMVGGNAGFGGWTAMTYAIPGADSMGDNVLLPAGVLMPGSDKVVNLFETEEYKKQMELVRSWYEKGYIMQDLATTTFTNIEIISGGNAFLNMTGQGSAADVVAKNASAQTSMPLDSKFISAPSLGTGNVTNQSWCVAVNSKHAEAALKFLNLTYCDADIANLINWGTEGRDYVVNEDGTVQPPEGFDSSSVPYPGGYMNSGNMYSGLEHPAAGTSMESIAWGVEQNKEAVRSESFGFVFDASSVTSQYAAVNNVIMQYYSSLDCGSVDPETEIPKFVQALKEAGIDDIIAAKQEQYDAWKAAH